jgi:hypothetical protein
MAAEQVTFLGLVKNGLVVPQGKVSLPEGEWVEITFPALITPELSEEMAAWDRAGDEAWAMIDQWEREE